MLPECLKRERALCMVTFCKTELLLTRVILLVIRPRNEHLYCGVMTATHCIGVRIKV